MSDLIESKVKVGASKPSVFISGVGKRVGYQLAVDFLDKGVPVVGTYRTWYEHLDELKEKGAHLHACDFYQQVEVDNLMESLVAEDYQLSAIIHNASDWLPDKCDSSLNQVIQRMMAVHVNVPYQINLKLSSLIHASEELKGDIIHITDYVAEKGSQKHIAYAASKAAMQNMTLSFSQLLAPKIKVNSIAPALIKFNDGDEVNYQEKAKLKALLPQEGGYEEMIRAVNYIISNQYMTGRTVHLDGGRHLKS